MAAAIVPPPSDDLPQKGFDPQVTRQLFAFMKPYQGQIIFALALMAINSLMAVAGPYLVKMALDDGIQPNSLPTLRLAMILYLASAIIQWSSIYFRVYLMARVGQSIIYDLRSNLFTHLQELSLSFFNHYSVGRIIVRIINDVNMIREFITWAMLAIARDLFTLVGIFVVMLTMNIRLSLFTFSVLPIMVVITIFFRKRSRENYRKTRAAISWVNSVLAENINAVRVVQSYSRQDHNFDHFKNEVNLNNLQTNLKAVKLSSLFFPAVDFLGSLAMGIVIAVGGSTLLGEPVTPGVLIAFTLYINRFFDPIRDLSQRFDTFQSTMASGERIIALLNAPIEVQDAPGAINLPPVQGEIEFSHVSFHYFDDPAPVLEEINLTIRPGQTVALVGKTGAGKTTLVKLVARFHDPTSGVIRVDDVDISTVTQDSLRSQMGIVLQDPFLFSGSVRENIRFGRLEATDEEVENAARAVGADEFISSLKDGYDTPVEEGGVILSQGQRQLISFARALLADPRILILDEATSSVDTQTERIIQQALTRLLKDRTSIVIAHRLSTVIHSDLILVIEDGRVIEQGTHTELLARHGHYFNLYSMRFED